MNQYDFRTDSRLPPQAAVDALQTRFALRVAAGLSERTAEIGPDLTERLRFAREKALERARATRAAATTPAVGVSRSARERVAPRSRYPSRSSADRWWWTADVEARSTANAISRTDGGYPRARRYSSRPASSQGK